MGFEMEGDVTGTGVEEGVLAEDATEVPVEAETDEGTLSFDGVLLKVT